MKKFFLITAFGKDRPGIVAGVTHALFELGGNLRDSSMTRLGGEFSIMLIADFPGSVTPAKLHKALQAPAQQLSLTLQAKPISPALGQPSGKTVPPRYLISVYGTDKPGILAAVSHVLAKHRVSITDLNTKTVRKSGAPLYILLLEIEAPKPTYMENLRVDLDRLRLNLEVDITLQDLDVVPL